MHVSRTAKLLLFLLLGLVACRPAGQQVLVQERKTSGGQLYTLFYAHNLAVRVVTERPKAATDACQLSIAAAYTDLATDQPLDLLVQQGRVLQTKPTISFLDGELTIMGDTLTITHLPTGEATLQAQIAKVHRQGGTLLLQELLVLEGKPQRFGPGNGFQRRALAEFAGRRFAVVESAADNLPLSVFAQDLRELGAKNALYLDMGDWDEGWYKAGHQVVKLGLRRTQTTRQSNWLLFARPATGAGAAHPAP